MASGSSTKSLHLGNKLDDINNNNKEIVFDFAPKFTSTQAPCKPTTRGRKRPSGEPLCADISNFWRRKKRNRMEVTKTRKSDLIMSEEVCDEARIDIVWADDDNIYLDGRSSIVNLKPIQENQGPRESSNSSDTGNNSSRSKEDEAALNQSRQFETDIVLNSLIISLKLEPKTDDKSDGNNQPVVTEPYKISNENNSIEPIVPKAVQCDPDPVPTVINSSQPIKPPVPGEIIFCPSLDEDAFNDDDDWLSQVPDDLLLKDSKAFVRKGEDGIISEALLRPRQNVPIPTREEILCKPNSQSSSKTTGKPPTIDQENKNILPDSTERKTIPNQNIRRSKLNFVKDPGNNGPAKPSISRNSTITNKPSSAAISTKPVSSSMSKSSSVPSSKQHALGEVTNTIKSQQTFSQSISKNQVKPKNTPTLVFAKPQSVNQLTIVPKQKVILEKKVVSEAPKSLPKDDEFIFDDDDDELFKNMDLDVIISSQTQPPPQPQSQDQSQLEVKTEPLNETVPMEEEDDFVWTEEDDLICCSIDVSILN